MNLPLKRNAAYSSGSALRSRARLYCFISILILGALEAVQANVAPASSLVLVEQSGFANLRIPLKKLSLGNTFAVPVSLCFSSKPASASSALIAANWTIPLFDSHAFLLNERQARILLPNGLDLILNSRRAGDNNFGGNSWTAVVEGNKITLSSSDGSLYSFVDGKLKTFQSSDGQIFIWERTTSKVEVVNKAKRDVVATLSKDKVAGGTEVQIESKTFFIKEGKRPIISNIDGRKVISSLVSAPNKVIYPNKKEIEISYEPTTTLDPRLTLIVNGKTLHDISWDAVTGFILNDGELSYSVKKDLVSFRTEITAKRSSDGSFVKKIWDNKNGTYNVKSSSREKIVSLFSSGPLIGKLRKVQIKTDGELEVRTMISYDEKARIARLKDDALGEMGFSYSNNGWLESVSLEDRKVFDLSGESDASNSNKVAEAFQKINNWRTNHPHLMIEMPYSLKFSGLSPPLVGRAISFTFDSSWGQINLVTEPRKSASISYLINDQIVSFRSSEPNVERIVSDPLLLALHGLIQSPQPLSASILAKHNARGYVYSQNESSYLVIAFDPSKSELVDPKGPPWFRFKFDDEGKITSHALFIRGQFFESDWHYLSFDNENIKRAYAFAKATVKRAKKGNIE